VTGMNFQTIMPSEESHTKKNIYCLSFVSNYRKLKQPTIADQFLLGERKGKSTRNLRTMNVLTALV
jgi:hypothetical protein